MKTKLKTKPLLSLLLLFFFTLFSYGQTSWTGSVDTDWFNAANWTAGVPDASDNVTINAGTNNPVINNLGAVADAITIYNGKILSIDVNGELSLNGSGYPLWVRFGGTVQNDGEINIGNVSDNWIALTNEGTFTNESNGKLTIDRWGYKGISNIAQYNTMNPAIFNNAGVIKMGSIPGPLNYNYGLINESNYATFNNLSTGVIEVDHVTTIAVSSGWTTGDTGTIFNNDGLINIGNGNTQADINQGIMAYGTFNHNSGQIIIDQATIGISLRDGSTFNNASSMILGANIPPVNYLVLAGGSSIFNHDNNGIIQGSGIIYANNFSGNGGTLIVGTPTGIITFNGSEDLSNTPIVLEINGMDAGVDFDQIVVFGDAIIGADLELSIGYVPSSGDVITILDASTSVSGTFNLVSPLPSDWTLLYDYPNAGEVSLVYPENLCPEITVEVTPYALDCFGYNYQLTIVPSGGTAPYTVTATGGTPSTTEADVFLFEGFTTPTNTVTISVTDADGCEVEPFDYELTNPTLVQQGTVEIVDASCANSTDGSVTYVGVSGGTPYTDDNLYATGYEYSLVRITEEENIWYDNQSSPTFSNLPPGLYNIGYGDGNGCGGVSGISFNIISSDSQPPVITCPGDLIFSADPGQCNAFVDFQFGYEDNSSLFVGIDFQTDPFTILDRTTTVNVFATGPELNNTGPQEIVFGPDGNIYVGIETLGKIVKYDGNTGSYLGDFVPNGIINGGSPLGIAFGPNGNLYVAEGNSSSNQILEFNGTSGTLINTFNLGTNNSLWDMAFGEDGALYVGANSSQSIIRLDVNTGTFSTFVTDPSINIPFGVAFGQDGDLFVSNSFANQIVRFDGVTGTNEGVYITTSSFPRELIFGPQGFFYIVGGNVVERYDAATGNFLNVYATDPSISQASGGAFGPDGLLYITNQATVGSILQVVPDRGQGTFPLGTTEVTINGTDDCGNTSSCSFTVTVIDEQAPEALCQNITVPLDNNGNAQISASQIDNGSSDNCGAIQTYIQDGASIGQTFSNSNFNNFGHGQSFTATSTGVLTEVRFYVNGNSSGRNIHFYNNGSGSGVPFDIGTPDYSESGVDLVDSVGGTIWTEVVLSSPLPVIAGNQYSFVIEGNTDIYYAGFNAYPGGAFIFANDLSSGCCEWGDIAFELSFATDTRDFSCSSVGDNEVTLLVVDESGNTATCSSTVTVEDSIGPEISCLADITVDANTANCGAIVALTGLGASDPCGVASASLSSNGETIFDYVFVDSGSGGLDQPRPMVFGPDGNLYVSNLINFTDDNVLRFDGTTGEFIDSFTAPGLLQYPRGLDFGPDGNLYVASNRTDEVLKFDGTTGALITSFIPAGGSLVRPTGLTFGPDGDLYVASAGTAEVQRYDGVTGAFEGVIGSGLSFPIGIIFGPDSNLYVANFGTSEILRFDGTSGTLIDAFVTSGLGGLAGPEDLEFGPDGNLYVTSFSSSQVLSYDGTTGAFLNDVSASGLSVRNPDGLTFGPDGHLYVSDVGNDRIVRYPTALEFPLGTTEVTYEVADASGNSTSCSFNVTVDGGFSTELLSYSLLAEEEVHLHGNNTVSSGNVGVLEDDGDAKIHDETVVVGQVIAADIDLDDDSSVGGAVMTPADVELPPFYYNTVSDGDSEEVTVEEGETVELNGDVYGKVEVKEGGTVIFTNSNVFLEELKTKDSGNVAFTGPANLYVQKYVEFDEETTFNSAGHTVYIYAEDDVKVDKGSAITANIYSLKEIEAKGKYDGPDKPQYDQPTSMNGLFIAKKIKGDDYVTWGAGSSCSPAEVVVPEVVADCECKGGMIEVTFTYDGTGTLSTNSGSITNNGDGTYTVSNAGEKLEKSLEISDGVNTAEIHTSCSKVILGLTFDVVFTVTAHTDNYGNTCEVPGDDDPGDGRSMEVISEFKVSSWPNPSDNFFNLKIATPNQLDKVEIQVIDISGKRVHSDTFNGNANYRFGEKLQSGIYFVRISQGENNQVLRVIKY